MAYVGNPIDTTNTFQSLVGKRFDGDGSTTDFTLDVAPGSVLDIEVFVGNVRQDPNSAYTLSGTTLSFTGAPPSGTNNIYVVHQAKSVGTIDVPALGVSTASIQADAVTSAKIADDSISDEHLDITAITGQTAITSLADTDKFLVSDASDSGNLKYVEKQYLPAGSWVLLETETVSSATSTVEINSMSSSYKTHAVVFDNVIPSSDNDTVRHAIKNSGGSVIQLYNGGDVSILDESGNRSDDTYGQNPTGYGTLAESNGSGSNEGFSGLIYYDSGMFDANLSTKYWGHIISFRANNTYAHSECYGRFANDTASAISYGFNAGNIASGTFKLYGIGG